MNATGAAVLRNPHPCGHIVYPYTDEEHVGDAVTLYTTAGLQEGESVILIVSASHCEPLRYRLRMAGFDPTAYEPSGRLTCVTTEDTLAELMPSGELDESRFKDVIGRMVSHARISSSTGRVRVFGEMVSQLRGHNLEATGRLEALWNEAIDEYSISLLCTYALSNSEDRLPCTLIDLHSHEINPI
jgi:hypothetical protein